MILTILIALLIYDVAKFLFWVMVRVLFKDRLKAESKKNFHEKIEELRQFKASCNHEYTTAFADLHATTTGQMVAECRKCGYRP